MSAKRVNIDEFSDDNIQEASGTKKVKVQKEGSEVNLFQQANQVSQSPFLKSPQDQDTTLSQSTDIMINDHRRPKKKQKSSSTSIGEVLKNEYINDPTSYVDSYQSLKYKDYLYKLDDNLLIRNESDSNNDFICKLTRIIRPINLASSKAIAFLEVQWYYKKNDLPKKYEQNLSCIGEAEVFLTNQKDFVMVDCINGLGQVLTYDEYDSLSKIVPNTYFTRGKFDISKKKVYPPFEKWEKHCICKTPLNPDYMYIQCDQCKMWFHIECLQLSSEQAQAMETYICDACNAKKKENTNDIQGDEQKEVASANKESKQSNLTSKEKVNVSNDASAVPMALSENKMSIENNVDNGTSGEAINSSFNNQDSEKDQNQEKAQNS